MGSRTLRQQVLRESGARTRGCYAKCMDTQPGTRGAGWTFAAVAIVLPSVGGAAGTWFATHNPMLTYVAFMTTWLFALIGVGLKSG